MNIHNIHTENQELRKALIHGIYFHGHLCPAMPIGLRAGLLAMRTLKVQRSQDKELLLVAETAEGHAMACFLDGVMVATGCTYGKGNCEKLRYGKLAFTLIDRKKKSQVRLSVKGDFVIRSLSESPFIAKRREGIPPQDIDPGLAEKVVNRVLSIPERELFQVMPTEPWLATESKGSFEAYRCQGCGEAVYAPWVRIKDGKHYCIPCSGYKRT